MAGRVKVKEFKKIVGDVNISGMFEEMMGIKDADADVIIPKFVAVRNILRYIYRIFHQFCNMLGTDFPMYAEHFDDIRKFAEELKESTYLKHDHDEKEDAYHTLDKTELNMLYKKLKENRCVKTLVILCSKLRRYESNFSDQNNMKENFVNQEPGLTFIVFDFSKLDLKALWSNDRMKTSVKRYVLMVLASIYKHTHALYRRITSPDVDVEKFTQMLLNAIGELKNQRELKRCRNAFRRIEQSVELLHEKFDDYYRDSIAAENADMLVMNFIKDVSNQGGANATLAFEFRTIIKYMNDVSQRTGKNKDPNVQKIFKMLNNNFSLMEKNATHQEDIMPTDELGTVDTTDTVDTADIAVEKQAKRIEKQKAKKQRKSKRKDGAQETQEPDTQEHDTHETLEPGNATE